MAKKGGTWKKKSGGKRAEQTTAEGPLSSAVTLGVPQHVSWLPMGACRSADPQLFAQCLTAPPSGVPSLEPRRDAPHASDPPALLLAPSAMMHPERFSNTPRHPEELREKARAYPRVLFVQLVPYPSLLQNVN